jgi:hypothetical protein
MIKDRENMIEISGEINKKDEKRDSQKIFSAKLWL